MRYVTTSKRGVRFKPTLRFALGLALLLAVCVAGPGEASADARNHDADLSVTKSVNNTQPLVGDQVVYTITVKNVGDDDAHNVEVTDLLPAGLVYVTHSASDASYNPDIGDNVWNLTELENGHSAILTFTVKVAGSVVIENCATATSDEDDPHLDNNTGCATIAPRAQVSFWQNANIESGTITAFASTASVPKSGEPFTLFVGSDGGGVWRSTDAGTNYFPTGLQSVNTRGLAASQTTEAVYAVTHGDGAFRSGDLGETFDLVFDDVKNLLSIAINNYNPKNGDYDEDGDVFIGTNGYGIFYSDDDGHDFDDVTHNLTNKIIRAIAVKEDGAGHNDDRVFVGTHGRGVWYLDYEGSGHDLDDEWKEANGGADRTLERAIVHALAIDDDGNVFAGTNEGLYKSTDDGDSWTNVLPGVVVKSLLYFTCTDDWMDYLVIGTDGDYVYRANPQYVGATLHQYDQGLQDRTILSFHYAGGRLFVGTQDHGVHRSEDCGETFVQVSDVSLQDAYRVMQALVFNSSFSRLYAGTFGFGVIMSDDLGAPFLNWGRVNRGLTNPWVYALALKEDKYLFAGTWNGGVFRSTDGGENWLFSGLPHRIVYDIAIAHGSAGTVYAATDRGEVARSVDNGLTWQEIGVAATAIWALEVDPFNSQVLYAGTFGAGVYKSIDGGFTWTRTALRDAHVFDFAVGVHPELGVHALFAATSTGVKYTLDGGASWDDFSTGLTVKDSRAIAFAGDDVLVGTWGGGVFLYDVISHSWIRDGLPDHAITLFAVNEASGEIFVASEGEGVFRKEFSATSTGVEPGGYESVPGSFLLDQNYPNPFNPSTKIVFEMGEAAPVRLSVYDVLGRQVEVLLEGMLSSGSHEVVFDARSLPSGTYFYRLETPQQTINRSMILMK